MANDLKTFAEKLVNLSVKDVQALSDILRDEYGIEPSVAVAAPAATAGGDPAGASAAEAEKSAFDVMLNAAGASKLAVVKLVKELTGLGLKEAKEIVDSAPKAIKEGVPKAEAEEMKKRLLEAGAEVALN